MTSTPPTQLPDTPLAVATNGLTKRYGTHTVLNALPLQVPEGAVYLLIGPNGAGKSTTMKILLDFVRPTAGTASIFGLDVQRDGALVRANIGYVPEASGWGYDWMRVDQLLVHHKQFYPSWDDAYAKRLATLFQLRLDQTTGKLSKGQARRAHLVMALAHRPPLLLLDEPTDGLDPIMRDETLAILTEHLAETPTTVLLSTHHVEEVERLADHIGVLRDGVLRAQVSLQDLHQSVRRYHAQVPPGWSGIPTLNGAVLRRTETRDDIQWIVWGDEADVRQQFERTHATVHDVSTVSLLDATVALLTPEPSSI